MIIQNNLKSLERMEALIASHMKLLLGNKYASYIHTAWNPKASVTRNVYEKTLMKRKKKGFQRRI